VRLRWTQLSELRCARRSIGRGWCRGVQRWACAHQQLFAPSSSLTSSATMPNWCDNWCQLSHDDPAMVVRAHAALARCVVLCCVVLAAPARPSAWRSARVTRMAPWCFKREKGWLYFTKLRPSPMPFTRFFITLPSSSRKRAGRVEMRPTGLRAVPTEVCA
jgi:hypothetical protein